MARKRLRPPPVRPAPVPVGPDGWPIGRDEDAIERKFVSARNRRITMQLANLENAVIGEKCFPALMDALALCTDDGRPLPSWLAGAIWRELDILYSKSKTSKRDKQRTEKMMRQYERWSDVDEYLDRRDELNLTREDVFQAVADRHHVSEEAVRKSYNLVRLLLRNDPGKLYWCMARYRPRRLSGVKTGAKKR